jgi:predicted double-glycine peptidase
LTDIMLNVLLLLCMLQGPGEQGQSARLQDYNSCGVTCLYAVCKIRQVPIGFEDLLKRVGPTGADGTHSFADLALAAEQLGLLSLPVESDLASLRSMPLPAIAHVRITRDPNERGHFIVLLSHDEHGFHVLDPPYPASYLENWQFTRIWTGKVLAFPPDAVVAGQIRARAEASSLQEWVRRLYISLACVSVLAMAGWLLFRLQVVQKLSAAWQYDSTRKRGYLILAAGFAIGGGYAWFLLSRPSGSPGPQCVIAEPVINLGELTPGKLSHGIRVSNPGGQPLHIESIRSSCTCAVAEPPRTIAAGSTTNLQVDIHVTPGPRQARIVIASNDARGPQTALLVWHGKANPALIPGGVFTTAPWPGQGLERTVQVAYPGGLGALVPTLEACDCDSKLVNVTAGRNDPTANRFDRSPHIVNIVGEQQLIVKIRLPERPGELKTTCKLRMKYGQESMTLTLPIAVRFHDDRLVPSAGQVVFAGGDVAALRSDQRSIILTGPAAAHSLEIADCPAWLRATITRRPDNKAVVLFRLAEGVEPGVLRSPVRIRARDEPSIECAIDVHLFAPGVQQ